MGLGDEQDEAQQLLLGARDAAQDLGDGQRVGGVVTAAAVKRSRTVAPVGSRSRRRCIASISVRSSTPETWRMRPR